MNESRNLRQRVLGNTNPVKLGRCFSFLKHWYGIKHGGHGSNQYVQNTNNSVSAKFQEDLAKEIGISVDTLQNYKKLTELIPELEDLVDTGIVTSTTALAIMRSSQEL